MKTKNILMVLLALTTISTFAVANSLYTSVGKLKGNAILGQTSTYKISYKWLTNTERSGKLIYHVTGTNCNGEVDIDKHSGLLPVSGEVEIKCIFDKSAVFLSDTQVKLYDTNKKDKEQSSVEHGKITVTNQ